MPKNRHFKTAGVLGTFVQKSPVVKGLNCFDFCLTFIRQMLGKSSTKGRGSGMDMIQPFLRTKESCMKVGQTFDPMQTYLSSIRQVFDYFQCSHQSRSPVQVDLTSL